MPSLHDHHTQAKSNLQFMETVSSQFPDWAITSRYYAAVHLVRACLASRGAYATNTHMDVRELLERTGFDRKVLLEYRILESLSRTARYECRPFAVLQPNVLEAQKLLEVLEAYILPRIQAQL